MLRPLQGAGVHTYMCSKRLISLFIGSGGRPRKLSLDSSQSDLLTVIVGCLSHF